VIRARVSRLAATVTIGSLLAIQAMAGSVGAAIPSADATSEAIPQFYTDGHAAGFRGFFHLTDTSTLSKLYLRIDVDPALATNVYRAVTRNGAAVPTNACDVVDQDVICTFKTVRTSDFFVAVAGYLPAAGQTSVTATYLWSSSGVPQNDDQSHGDSWDGIAHTATLNNTDQNYGGGLITDTDLSIGNSPIGPGNLQATRVVGVPAGTAVTVLDGSTATGTCTTTPDVDCTKLGGEWSEVTVGDGQNFPVFSIQIVFASGTPKGFVHTFIGSDGTLQQEFIGTCAKKNPTYPCFTWSAKTNTATIFTLHNGSYKGLF
jgi:hypothetical protein